MTKLQQSSVSLVMLALCPRLRGNFINGFEFEFLGGIRTMPISEKSITIVMESLLRLANIDKDEVIRKFVHRQMKFLTTQLRPYRHAECTLIHHLTILKSQNVEMNFCSYLGGSKLSCLGCSKWIDCFNTCHNTRWATSGTHGKIYPWGYFETQEEITENIFRTIKQAHLEVREVFAHRCRTRFGSDPNTHSAIPDSSTDEVSVNFEYRNSPISKAENCLDGIRARSQRIS